MLCDDLDGWKDGGWGRWKDGSWREVQEGADTCMLTADSHCYTTETNTIL